jgi:exopolysaccharide biosynthesis polyprenyl glycosylphosphotransferase
MMTASRIPTQRGVSNTMHKVVVRPVLSGGGPKTEGWDPSSVQLPPVRPRKFWTPLLHDGVRPLFLTTDLLACVAAVWVSSLPIVLGIVFTAGVLLQFSARGLYRSRLTLSLLDDLPDLFARSLSALAIVALAGLAVEGLDSPIHSSWLPLALTSTSLLVLGRATGYLLVRHLRARRVVAHRTLVVGTGAVGRQVAATLANHPKYGLEPVGFIESSRQQEDPTLRLPVVGGPEHLPGILDASDVRVVVLAYGRMAESDLVELARSCQGRRCEFFLVPRLYEISEVSSGMDSIWGTPLVRLRRSVERSWTWRLKRMLDVIVAALALCALAPMMLACAVVVRYEVGPGVIFRQERVGYDGKRFLLMKFRTLRPGDALESHIRWNIAHDERLHPVGRFLRVTSLDELPQFWNILRGDMSLVGPRPERPHFVEQFRHVHPCYMDRHRVPSGLTGWAQIHGLRGDTSISDRARFDNFYIENWSLWLDLKILMRTAVSLVRSPGS